MKLVKQRIKGECGVACLAMVLDLTIDDVISHIEAHHQVKLNLERDGLSDRVMLEVLQAFGYAGVKAITDREDRRPCILTVPSLNYRGLLHYIVWDGEAHLDPCPGPLFYPKDAPEVAGSRSVQWASAIVWDDEPPIVRQARKALMKLPPMRPLNGLEAAFLERLQDVELKVSELQRRQRDRGPTF